MTDGIAIVPHVIKYGISMVGWFPPGRFTIMIATAVMTDFLLFYGKCCSGKAHRHAIRFGIALWTGPAVNIMEANTRDPTICFRTDTCCQCASD